MAIHSTRKRLIQAAAIALCAAAASSASAQTIYSQGFELDLSDSAVGPWSGGGVARVASGTGGIASAGGSFHAVSTGSATLGRWGGYNYGAGNAVPTVFQEYTTSIDIFLDVSGSLTNGTRFDFSSAINNAAGTHRRDFIFNAGFYTVTDATGSAPRFVISGGNNTQPGSAFPQNPGHSPIAITTTGWYTFEHHFYNNGGTLAVNMSITDAANTVVGTWALSDVSDLIGLIGGNRYAYFDFNEVTSGLAFDNATLTIIPTPAAAALLGLGGLMASRRRR